MNELSCQYLGFDLKNPIIASASPLSRDLGGMRRLEDSGLSAIVMYSLFEEQINHESLAIDHYLEFGADSHGDAMSYFPNLDSYNVGPDEYLKLISKAKESVDIPLIASLNGVSTGGWTEYAQLIEDAGADALELNIYYIPTDTSTTGAEIEQMYIDTLREVRDRVSIPVAVKIGPYFSATANMCLRFAQAGADGLVLFNRFYQPDLHLANLEVIPHLVMSSSYELRLPLRWVAILYGRVSADMAITTGIHTWEDVLKAMMAGANVAMMASELLHNGLGRVREILGEITRWMQEYEYESIAQMRGSLSQRHVAEPAAFERANYMKVLDSFRAHSESLVM